MRDGKTLAFPANGLKESMVRAGAMIGKTDMKKIRSSLFVVGLDEGDMLTIECDEHRLHKSKGRNQKGNLIDCIRAECVNWSAKVIIKYNAEVMAQDKILKLISTAGFGVGIGAWRPECKGQFGRFSPRNVTEETGL